MEPHEDSTLRRLTKQKIRADHLQRKWRHDTSVQLFVLVAVGIFILVLVALFVFIIKSMTQTDIA